MPTGRVKDVAKEVNYNRVVAQYFTNFVINQAFKEGLSGIGRKLGCLQRPQWLKTVQADCDWIYMYVDEG